jgi:hypothetical protein
LDAGCVTNADYFLVIRPTSENAEPCTHSFIGEKGVKAYLFPGENMNFWGIASKHLIERDGQRQANTRRNSPFDPNISLKYQEWPFAVSVKA